MLCHRHPVTTGLTMGGLMRTGQVLEHASEVASRKAAQRKPPLRGPSTSYIILSVASLREHIQGRRGWAHCQHWSQDRIGMGPGHARSSPNFHPKITQWG